MDLKDFYDGYKIEGDAIIARIVKAGRMFRRQRVRASSFLDIGCGAGNAALYLAQVVGATVIHGVELSAPAADRARSRGIDVHSLDLNCDPLPMEDGSVDAMFCGEVLEHLVDTDHLMREMRRVLGRNGLCVVSTPNLAAWHNRLALLFGYQPFLTQVSFEHGPGRPKFAPGEGGGHLRIFTHRALVEFAAIHRFDVVDQCGVGYWELGGEAQGGIARTVVRPLDAFFTLWPPLACDVILGLRRRSD